MKLTITSSVMTNVGLTASGLIGTINANTSNLMADGSVICTMSFYANDNAKSKSMSMLFPVILSNTGNIEKIVSACTVTLTQPEIVGANLPGTIYTKAAEKLSTEYGWTVTAS